MICIILLLKTWRMKAASEAKSVDGLIHVMISVGINCKFNLSLFACTCVAMIGEFGLCRVGVLAGRQW